MNNLIGTIRIWYGKLQHESQRWMLKKCDCYVSSAEGMIAVTRRVTRLRIVFLCNTLKKEQGIIGAVVSPPWRQKRDVTSDGKPCPVLLRAYLCIIRHERVYSHPRENNITTCCTLNPMSLQGVSPVSSPIRTTTSKPWHQRVHQRRKRNRNEESATIDRVICTPEELPVSLLVIAASSELTGSVRIDRLGWR